jgi:hypothetical protein
MHRETHWLGGEGSNGIIRLERRSEPGTEEALRPDAAEWKGIGFQLQQANG